MYFMGEWGYRSRSKKYKSPEKVEREREGERERGMDVSSASGQATKSVVKSKGKENTRKETR